MEDHQPSLLENPITVSDLIGTGTKFQINAENDNGIFDNMCDGTDILFEDDDDNGIEVDFTKMKSPWLKPFEELKQQMVQIDENIYKRIVVHGNMEKGAMSSNSRVHIRYNSYWEGEGGPFDSSSLRGTVFSFYTGKHSVLEGIEKAVLSMYEGEESQFIISYKLLFGVMGCPPRVKKRADGLYVIELVSFNAVGDLDAVEEMSEEDRKNYAEVAKRVKEIHLKGLDFFKLKNNKNAAFAFERAVQALEQCNTDNDEDEKDRKQFLIKLYTNLALLYNNLEKPREACKMTDAICMLSNDKPTCKALFQKGRALLKLGEFEKAKKILIRAQRMEPNNHSINKELDTLEVCYRKHHENEATIWQRALGFQKQKEVNTIPEAKNISADFKNTMLEILADFKKQSTNKLHLPPNLTNEEIDYIDKLAQELQMYLQCSDCDKSYLIYKH